MPPMVVIPTNSHSKRRVRVDKIQAILSNRIEQGDEQYLVRWTSNIATTKPPLSWHSISELVRCLEHVQDYLDTREGSSHLLVTSKKRKSPETELDIERRPSPFDRRLQQNTRNPSTSRSSSVSSAVPSTSNTIFEVYNGVLDADENGFIFCRPANGPAVPTMDIRTLSTTEMTNQRAYARVDKALTYIREAYVRRLARIPGQPIHLINLVDSSTPSLRFRYIAEYVLDEKQGVYRASSETQEGCMSSMCKPNNGRHIGCEYTQQCACLEYAAVDESRLKERVQEYHDAIDNGLPTIGFPKKFPYWTQGTKRERSGCLVAFYLESRHPIYECNDKCGCGINCRNKNVQFGRTVEVEIFRTAGGRGWGLRCREDLHKGQFIDTYRGEVITDAEATRRENVSSKAKSSYLYSLDKFAVSERIDDKDLYVVDGEFMGGPTKFINHSCEPNCRQYTVSYNKHDPRVYDLAFFACRFIKAGEELTFDYLDKDEDEEDECLDQPGEDAVACLCGAEHCRKWLWT